MIFRFNKNTLELIRKTGKRVAKKLRVEEANLCITTGPNAAPNGEKTKVSLCFETNEDDTFAVLDLMSDQETSVEALLNSFMVNPEVDWRKHNNIPEPPALSLTWEELRQLDELTENLNHHKVLNKVREFIDEHSV